MDKKESKMINELRFGNWVEIIPGKLHRVDHTIIGLLQEESINIKGIILSEDIMIAAGFECFQDGWYGLDKVIIKDAYRWTWNIYDRTLLYPCGTLNHILCVHQLQNAYYSIIGTELEINL